MTSPASAAAKPRKGLIVIVDGLGDRPSPFLDGRTPLEAAHTPNLDSLLAKGQGGMVSPVGLRIPIGTQVGTGVLIGVPRRSALKMGRGMIEAAGAGVTLSPKDVAIRTNFATLRKNTQGFEILDRRAGRIDGDCDALVDAVDGLQIDGVSVTVRRSSQHRAVVVLSGDGLSASVSDTDPGAGRGYVGVLPSRPTEDTAEAKRTSGLINKISAEAFEALSDHPINKRRSEMGLAPGNGFIMRGASAKRDLVNLLEGLGIRTSVVTGEGTVRGLGQLFGFSVIVRPEFTATTSTDLRSKVASARKALAESNLVYLHIKGTDTSAHDFNPEGKRDFIAHIDAALAPLLSPELVIGITADHSTDSNTGRHTGDPVPTILYSPNSRIDNLTTYSEKTCVRGGLGTMTGTNFLCAVLDQMNELPNYRPDHFEFYR